MSDSKKFIAEIKITNHNNSEKISYNLVHPLNKYYKCASMHVFTGKRARKITTEVADQLHDHPNTHLTVISYNKQLSTHHEPTLPLKDFNHSSRQTINFLLLNQLISTDNEIIEIIEIKRQFLDNIPDKIIDACIKILSANIANWWDLIHRKRPHHNKDLLHAMLALLTRKIIIPDTGTKLDNGMLLSGDAYLFICRHINDKLYGSTFELHNIKHLKSNNIYLERIISNYDLDFFSKHSSENFGLPHRNYRIIGNENKLASTLELIAREMARAKEKNMGNFFIIEEAELFLDTEIQLKFVKVIDDFIEFTDPDQHTQVLIGTQSPYIISEFANDQIIVDTGKIKETTLGASPDAIVKIIFGIDPVGYMTRTIIEKLFMSQNEQGNDKHIKDDNTKIIELIGDKYIKHVLTKNEVENDN